MRFAAPTDDPTGPDGIIFDLGSLQAQFADIPDPEDKPVDPAQAPPPPPPPPPPRRRKPPAPPAPPPPAAPKPIDDENWAANWKPPPARARVERTMLVAPITDDEDDLPEVKPRSSTTLTLVMVIAGVLLLVAVVWLMLNPPEPTKKKGRSDVAPAASVQGLAGL